MELFVFGFSHKTVPYEFLGRVAIPVTAQERVLRGLGGLAGVEEAAVLSTCNRTEFYLVGDFASDLSEALFGAVGAAQGIEVGELAQHAFVMRGRAAARHLLAVASGIDSLVVGEQEILGQVRLAIDGAREAGTAGEVLTSIFTRALRTGRRVRHETSISRGKVSIATLAAQMLSDRDAGLAERSVLVIGTGEMGRQTAAAMAEYGVRTLSLANRSPERAVTLAQSLGCLAIPMEELIAAFRSADIVICATGAPHAIVTREMAEAAGPRVYVDLSAPPNVAPEVARVPGVLVLTIEDLEESAARNAKSRVAAVHSAETLVEQDTTEWMNWLESRPTERLVAQIHRQMESIRQQHLARYGNRFPGETRDRLDTFTRSLLSAVLHRLTRNLEALGEMPGNGDGGLELVRRLFEIAEEDPAAEKQSLEV